MSNLNKLRPSSFDEFFGQKQIVNELKVYIYSAIQKKKTLDHILLFGPSGTGKTTLAILVAKEIKAEIKIINAPLIETIQDLIEILANISEGDILFIDEIHRLDKKVEEVLYSALEDFVLNIPYKSNEKCKIISVKLPKFTMIGATTLNGMISTPLRERFGIKFHFENYSLEEMGQIIQNNMTKVNLSFTYNDLSLEFADRTKLNPRIAINLVKRLEDFAIYKNTSIISKEYLDDFFNFMNIDEHGLTEIDKRIIKVMYENFQDQPVGLESIASVINENILNIREIYEPYLVISGFIVRTRRGRVLTKAAKAFYYTKILK